VLFAHHFGRRLPRWADEGGAIVSESEAQRAKHRKSFAGMLTEGRQFPLRKFFGMEDYPADIPCFYAQGHSISGYLVAARGHKAFLAFVQTGLDSNWDNAAREQYGYQNVEDMERDWLNYLGRQARMAP
jgi:hypothetical protein